MNINDVLKKLDNLFKEKRFNEVENFLLENLEQAEQENDISSIITIINELIGFYRVSSRFKDAIVYCDKVIEIMKSHGLEDTVNYATTLLNIGTLYRESGRLEKSLKYYKEALAIYKRYLDKNDYKFASLYNNMSLLYQDMNANEKAYNCLINALEIVTILDLQVQIAITHINLANCLLQANKLEKALKHIKISLSIFEKDRGAKSLHYSAALATMGKIQFELKEYGKSIENYLAALEEIKSNIGDNVSYVTTCNNLSLVYEKIGNIEKANEFRNEAKRVSESIKR